MTLRDCVNSPDNFYFFCGEYLNKNQQKNISDFLKKVYFAYFKLKFGDYDKFRDPHKVCRKYKDDLHL